MMPDLFLKSRARESLRDFASRIEKVLNLPALERRESSHYVGGEYFRCAALAIEVTIALSDESDLDDYAFWIVLEPEGAWVVDRAFLEGLADLLARRLTIAGERAMRLSDSENKPKAKRIFYALNPGASHLSDDEVITTER